MIFALVVALLVFGASHAEVDACTLRKGPEVQTWAQCQERAQAEALRRDLDPIP